MSKRGNSWHTRQSENIGIPEKHIKKAFKGVPSKKAKMDDPLEIPDRIEIYYKYSYGGVSRFFRELRENKRILGSKCPRCKIVYLPPRVNCSECYIRTRWVPLGNEGTVITCTTVHYATSRFFYNVPFVTAYIKMDGADTLLLQNVVMKDVKRARPGMRVKVEFKKERNGDMGDFYFVPL